MEVNFIADPWKWGRQGSMQYGDTRWMAAYREFKARLHWLLLWNDVKVVDSFVLFNRQFEQWFDEAKLRRVGSKALEEIFKERALRIALRKHDIKFSTLTDIDSEHVRGNPKFRWFYGGPPSKDFVSELDGYLGLPDRSYSTWYEGSNRPNRMRECFVAALERKSGFEAIYREFRLLRQGLLPHVAQSLLKIRGDDWRRSELYTRLGYGLDKNGQTIQKGADLASLPEEVRHQLLHLVDWSFFFAIHDALDLPSQFPGEGPPEAFYEMFPPSRAGLSRQEEKEEASWICATLRDVDVSSVQLEGDVVTLWNRFRDLDVEDVWALRKTTAFDDYRKAWRDFNVKMNDARFDPRLCDSVVNCKFRCLAELGNRCEVSIKKSRLGQIALRFFAVEMPPRILLWGLGILTGIPGVDNVLEEPIVFLNARVQHLMTKDRTLRAKVRYLGPIRTSD